MAKKRRIATSSSAALEARPLAGLAELMGAVPDAEAVPPQSAPESATPRGVDEILAARLVVRREKKGRGGKAVTLVEGLKAEVCELQDLARRMKKDFGCGAHVEGSNVVLQGAQTDRVRAWLIARGAEKVVVGN